MGQHDWYRNTTWTEDIREAFFKRLNRSRGSYNKAQYVRIQAWYLQQTGKRKNILEALRLLDLMLEKWPEPWELASAYLQRAECFGHLGDYKSAIQSFRDCIKAEQDHPGVRVGAVMEFGWFVVNRKMSKYYDEVLLLIEPNENGLDFPVLQFKYFSVISIILGYIGQKEDAKRFAELALEAMRKTESQFSYHKKLGLVENPPKAIVKKLKKIVAN